MKCRIACVLAVCAAVALAQSPPVTILEVDLENTVSYLHDSGEQPKLSTVPGIITLPADAHRSFKWAGGFGDIVAVNGKPAKGSWTGRFLMFYCVTAYTPGRMISDMSCGCSHDEIFSIMYPDGTPIGAIMTFGYGGSPAAVGAPRAVADSNTTVVGGTGAFLGARGQAGWGPAFTGFPRFRWTSMLEDPANRRANGGGKWRHVIHLIPMTWPEVVMLSATPAIYHSDDFSLVTADKPARAGERLIMGVSGLGPVRPNIDPGKAFPVFEEGKTHEVNSPVEVTVNGREARVVNKFGWPAQTNVYRVDFVVPDGTAPGLATLGLSVAWINGPEVKVPVR